MNARDFGGDAAERTAAGSAGFGIPRFELTWGTAQPQQDAMLLRFFRFGSEDRIVKQTGETRHGRQRAASKAFQKQTTVQHMISRRAGAWRNGAFLNPGSGIRSHGCDQILAYGTVRNSAPVIKAHKRSRTPSAALSGRS